MNFVFFISKNDNVKIWNAKTPQQNKPPFAEYAKLHSQETTAETSHTGGMLTSPMIISLATHAQRKHHGLNPLHAKNAICQTKVLYYFKGCSSAPAVSTLHIGKHHELHYSRN